MIKKIPQHLLVPTFHQEPDYSSKNKIDSYETTSNRLFFEKDEDLFSSPLLAIISRSQPALPTPQPQSNTYSDEQYNRAIEVLAGVQGLGEMRRIDDMQLQLKSDPDFLAILFSRKGKNLVIGPHPQDPHYQLFFEMRDGTLPLNQNEEAIHEEPRDPAEKKLLLWAQGKYGEALINMAIDLGSAGMSAPQVLPHLDSVDDFEFEMMLRPKFMERLFRHHRYLIITPRPTNPEKCRFRLAPNLDALGPNEEYFFVGKSIDPGVFIEKFQGAHAQELSMRAFHYKYALKHPLLLLSEMQTLDDFKFRIKNDPHFFLDLFHEHHILVITKNQVGTLDFRMNNSVYNFQNNASHLEGAIINHQVTLFNIFGGEAQIVANLACQLGQAIKIPTLRLSEMTSMDELAYELTTNPRFLYQIFENHTFLSININPLDADELIFAMHSNLTSQTNAHVIVRDRTKPGLILKPVSGVLATDLINIAIKRNALPDHMGSSRHAAMPVATGRHRRPVKTTLFGYGNSGHRSLLTRARR